MEDLIVEVGVGSDLGPAAEDAEVGPLWLSTGPSSASTVTVGAPPFAAGASKRQAARPSYVVGPRDDSARDGSWLPHIRQYPCGSSMVSELSSKSS